MCFSESSVAIAAAVMISAYNAKYVLHALANGCIGNAAVASR